VHCLKIDKRRKSGKSRTRKTRKGRLHDNTDNVDIDIGTLTEQQAGDYIRLKRAKDGRAAAGQPLLPAHARYTIDAADQVALETRLKQVRLDSVITIFNNLYNDADIQHPQPWNGANHAAVDEPETVSPNSVRLRDVEANWTGFLGAGPYNNRNPRTGVADTTRLVSQDGTKSIRYGNHERSADDYHHFHQESWELDVATNEVHIKNKMFRAPVNIQ